MCSSTRGPAIMPSLVTWPTSSTVMPRRLASRISSAAQARTWATVPGAEFERVDIHRLDRIDDDQVGRVGPVEAGAGCPAHWSRRRAPPSPSPGRACRRAAEPGRSPPRRRCRRPRLCPRQRRGHLQQQSRFADARIAADQERRAGDEAAAADPVEFGDARDTARRGAPCALERREIEPPAAFGRNPLGRGVGRGLLDQRVPGAAGLALARPLCVRGAAFLADIAVIALWPCDLMPRTCIWIGPSARPWMNWST